MIARLSLIVADDEPLARWVVRRLVADIEQATIVAECTSGDELGDVLATTRADVLLLDVKMPGRDVFDVLVERTRDRAPLPAVIFTTAYDRYAVRAFELNAADYLVKPLVSARFGEAIARARHRTDAADALGRLARDLGPRPERLLVPQRGRMVPIDVAEIDWIQAEGDYARIHVGGKSYLVSRGMNDLERRLDPDRFLRIHGSAIVNADRIRDVKTAGSSRYSVRLADGSSLIVSRGRADGLRRWRI
jgi:two-component system, LytTR family, response regulator